MSGLADSRKPLKARFRRGDEHDVYGSRYALSVSIGQNQAKLAWVLNISISEKKQGSKEYDRDGALRIQIGERELSDFFACMTDRLVKIELKRSKDLLSKSFKIDRDKDSGMMLISLRTSDMGSASMVKAMKSDQLKLGMLAFRCLLKNNGGIGQEVIYMMHRDIYVGNEITG